MLTKNRPDHDRLKQTITIFGRNSVLEALSDDKLHIDRVHMASSNKPGGAMQIIDEQCTRRDIERVYHSRKELSRISRNGRQDQGVAADVYCAGVNDFDRWLDAQGDVSTARLIVLDGLTNPQNIGMIIRSCFAAGVNGILMAGRDLGILNPLLIKASAGTAFRAPLLYSRDLPASLRQLNMMDVPIYCLAADAELQLFEPNCPTRGAFVLGNETDGVSANVRKLCTDSIAIPMNAEVESLNVAVSAALLAFRICR